MVETHRDSPAVKDGSGSTLSYEQLDRKVNAIASQLRTARGRKVGVFQEPSSDWVASLLAIWRAGAVYVPLDVRTPLVRLATIVKDCRPATILTHAPTAAQAQSFGTRTLKVINISNLPAAASSFAWDDVQPDSPAMVVYTSGTTGVPKGVVISHVGIRNNIEATSKIFGVDAQSTVLQQSAYSFDMSVWQALLGVANGACLAVVSSARRADPRAVADWIAREAVTLTVSTPSELMSWIQAGDSELLQKSSWQCAVSGGEKFPKALLTNLRSMAKPGLRVLNAYGPTEISISCHHLDIDYWQDYEEIPVGKTIMNAAVYVMDATMNCLPVGVPGEVVIGGIGVAAGYLNNEELSKQRFVSDAATNSGSVVDGRTTMYRTGDRGRMRKDGSLVLEGRIDGDTQVKLRGIRIELEDIENNIMQAAGGVVVEAVASLRDDLILTHVVFAKDKVPDDQDSYLQKLLATLPLPQYMIPSMIIPLERMPVTKHFKLDRNSLDMLPLPQLPQAADPVENLSQSELSMRSIWHNIIPGEVARYHFVNEDADFFHIGGSSILLMKLQAEIKKQFGAAPPLPRLFEASTLRQMTAAVLNERGGSKNTIDWEAETAVALDISRPLRAAKQTPGHSTKIVALTGPTGFLGRALLNRLIKNPSIAQIHCVAVRGGVSRTLPDLFSSLKVTVHRGDLSLPQLGLSAATVEVISNVDAIIHNGADVSFLKTYSSLRRVNVDATRYLAQIAAQNGIPFHYVSTAGVARLSELAEFDEVSASAYTPPQDGSDGYTTSKWVSEVMLERLARQSGLPVWIHRPSSIMGDGAAETDLMANMLQCSLAMRAVPVLQSTDTGKDGARGSLGGYLDLVDVEVGAGGILNSVMEDGSTGSEGWLHEVGPVRYMHHSGEMVIPLSVLGAEAEAGSSGDVRDHFAALTLSDWIAKAKQHGLNSLVAELLDTVQDGSGGLEGDVSKFFWFPRLLKRQAGSTKGTNGVASS